MGWRTLPVWGILDPPLLSSTVQFHWEWQAIIYFYCRELWSHSGINCEILTFVGFVVNGIFKLSFQFVVSVFLQTQVLCTLKLECPEKILSGFKIIFSYFYDLLLLIGSYNRSELNVRSHVTFAFLCVNVKTLQWCDAPTIGSDSFLMFAFASLLAQC